jgi:cytoskeletal protein CcmA (bactofilin family)
MLSLRRNDRPADPNVPLKPALYEPPGRVPKPAPGTATPAALQPAPHGDPPAAANARPDEAQLPTPAASTAPKPQAGTSKLFIGANIKLKGVEISDCDVMVIEGHVEATVHSQAMEIAGPGTLKGTAMIDVAEIHGEFSGELTARTRLVVHGTGRVSGTIRYGKLVVAEGGELNGDVKRLDASAPPPRDAASRAPTAPGTTVERTPH